jgi:beta-phosphoglucomutase-like phosphatase (HAD superfamily)
MADSSLSPIPRGKTVLRAIIFDFDGIIVDSEPLIFQLTLQMAAQEGWTITEDEYYRDYLALDDRGIIEHLYRSHGRPIDAQRRDELVEWKMRAYADEIRDGLPPLPGALESVRSLATQFPLAIASGSFRSEIEYLLGKLGLRDAFQVVVAADDVERSKPAPDIFLKALDALRDLSAFRAGKSGSRDLTPAPLLARECLVIEDAPNGVRAAHAAGMPCLALAHSRPTSELVHADWVSRDFTGIDMTAITTAFRHGPR